MRVLADNGSFVLAEDEDRLLFLRRRILPTWTVFVPGLLAVIALGNAVVQLVLGNVAVGVVLALVGVAAAFGVRATVASRRRAKARPLRPDDAVVVIDQQQQALLGGDGRALAALRDTRVVTTMPATSSARALRVVWPGGGMVVYRGDALLPGGSIDAAVEALRARGVPVA